MRAEGVEPGSWRELSDEALRVRRDAYGYVLEVVKGRHVDQFTALDQRIEHRGTPRSFETASKC